MVQGTAGAEVVTVIVEEEKSDALVVGTPQSQK